MSLPKLSIAEIADLYVRENFRRLQSFFREESPLLGFQHIEITIQNAVSAQKFPHNLGFLPKDIILLSSIGSGVATLNYDQFTATDLVITTTGAVTLRLLAGTYQRGPT